MTSLQDMLKMSVKSLHQLLISKNAGQRRNIITEVMMFTFIGSEWDY